MKKQLKYIPETPNVDGLYLELVWFSDMNCKGIDSPGK
jgi:hypothetical protein